MMILKLFQAGIFLFRDKSYLKEKKKKKGEERNRNKTEIVSFLFNGAIWCDKKNKKRKKEGK